MLFATFQLDQSCNLSNDIYSTTTVSIYRNIYLPIYKNKKPDLETDISTSSQNIRYFSQMVVMAM